MTRSDNISGASAARGGGTLTNRLPDNRNKDGRDEVADIVSGFLAQQARTASDQQRPRRRGTHAKGMCVGGIFEVPDLSARFEPILAQRLARGIFAKAGTYKAIIRFANSDPSVNSDWQPDVRGLSFSIESAGAWDGRSGGDRWRQDFSLQSAPTLPFNDVHAFAVFGRVLTARNETVGLASLSVDDQLVYARTNGAVLRQQRQPVRPYQQLRYWSNVPFRHGSDAVVKYSATPLPGNHALPLAEGNANALLDELTRHVNDDPLMSSFDFGVQFLDSARMTHDGTRRDDSFWIENASVEWPEDQSPFHTVARLTLVRGSVVAAGACESGYIDVNENSAPEHAPVGEINRARRRAELASREARRQP